jgi:hypothetical protein
MKFFKVYQNHYTTGSDLVFWSYETWPTELNHSQQYVYLERLFKKPIFLLVQRKTLQKKGYFGNIYNMYVLFSF